MKFHCPICNKKLYETKKYHDYQCYNDVNHFYIHNMKNDKIAGMIFRLNDFVVDIDFDRNTSIIRQRWGWKSRSININNAFQPDFSDLKKLKQKLKFY